MSQSIPKFIKPSNNYDISDWISNIQNLSTGAHSNIDQAFSFRSCSSSLRDKTEQKTIFNTDENNRQISQRIGEIEELRETLEKSLADINKEIDLLSDERVKTENEVEILNQLLHGISKATSMRDSRISTELIHDLVDCQFIKEESVAEINKNALVSQSQSMWIHLNKLKKIKSDLLNDINTKTNAFSIDTEQLALNKDSTNISYKIDPLRHHKKCLTYGQWSAKTLAEVDECSREIQRSVALRHDAQMAREKARNDMRERDDAAEHELRRRIFDIRRAIDFLSWEKGKVEDSMEKILVELSKLKSALFVKDKCLKLAETRLENRAHRLTEELVCDYVDEGLKMEVIELNDIRRQLQDKIDMAKATYNGLENSIVNIVLDIEKKNKALEIEVLCSRIREEFPSKINTLYKLKNNTLDIFNNC